MRTLWQLLFIFLAITVVSTVMIQQFNVDFGTVNYWQKHGFFFLVFLTLFPRLTLLFSSVASGGFFWWLAWLIAPRFLVAFLATVGYWKTNPVLVTFSWLVALTGESSEKTIVINRKSPFTFKRTFVSSEETPSSQGQSGTFEAEYKVKEEKDL